VFGHDNERQRKTPRGRKKAGGKKREKPKKARRKGLEGAEAAANATGKPRSWRAESAILSFLARFRCAVLPMCRKPLRYDAAVLPIRQCPA